MKSKCVIFLLLLCLTIFGCTSVPYVRSDAFLDQGKVQSIYVMPVAYEITLDSDFEISREELRGQLTAVPGQIKKVIFEEFSKRGYTVAGYSKDFSQLDKRNPDDQLIRNVVFEFLEPTAPPRQNLESQIMEEVILGLIKSAEISVTDENGQKRILDQKEEAKSNEDKTKEQEPLDPLIEKVLAAQSLFPEDIDTVILLKVESFMAPRGWWNKLTEESTMTVSLTMVSLPEKKTIFSYTSRRERSDLLDNLSVKEALKDVLERVPVKL